MKKIVALLLLLLTFGTLLAACAVGTDTNVTTFPETTVSKSTVPETTAQEETVAQATQSDTSEATAVDVTETSESEPPADSFVASGYESYIISRDGREVTVYYDADYVKKSKYSNSTTEIALVGVKDALNVTLRVSEHTDPDEYINANLSAMAEDSNYLDVTLSSVEEVQYSETTLKVATISYNVKSYDVDKLEGLTDDQIDQLEYTLEEQTATYKMIQVSDEILLEVITAGKDSNLETAFASIVIQPTA